MGYLVIERQEDEPTVRWFPGQEQLSKHLAESGIENVDFVDESCNIPGITGWPSYTTLVFKGEFIVPKARYVVDGVDVP